MKDLGTLGGNDGQANSINDAGEIVGWATSPGDQAVLAFLWRNGTIRNLGTVDRDPCSIAWGINSKGQIGGASWDCGPNYVHAFLWENGGPSVDLNTLVPHRSGVQLTVAVPNDRGELIAEGVLTNGENHAFLLIPCDENHGGDEDCMSEVENSTPVPQSKLAQTQVLINVVRPKLSPEIMTTLRPPWSRRYFVLGMRQH
jgi:probable HAF family extracellular repeat protein